VLLVETNILLAAADTSTPEHEGCEALLEGGDSITITAAVAVETAWMIESRLGPSAESVFVASVATGGLAVVDLTAEDWRRCAALIELYRDLKARPGRRVRCRRRRATGSDDDRDLEPAGLRRRATAPRGRLRACSVTCPARSTGQAPEDAQRFV
jgi:hypothetical protein